MKLCWWLRALIRALIASHNLIAVFQLWQKKVNEFLVVVSDDVPVCATIDCSLTFNSRNLVQEASLFADWARLISIDEQKFDAWLSNTSEWQLFASRSKSKDAISKKVVLIFLETISDVHLTNMFQDFDSSFRGTLDISPCNWANFDILKL